MFPVHLWWVGYVIPAGWKILPILGAVHVDPLHHLEPEQFQPRRWEVHISIYLFLSSVYLSSFNLVIYIRVEWEISLIHMIHLSSELQTGAEPAGWQELRAVRRWTAALPWIGDCQSGGCFLPAPPCAQLQVLYLLMNWTRLQSSVMKKRGNQANKTA